MEFFVNEVPLILLTILPLLSLLMHYYSVYTIGAAETSKWEKLREGTPHSLGGAFAHRVRAAVKAPRVVLKMVNRASAV